MSLAMSAALLFCGRTTRNMPSARTATAATPIDDAQRAGGVLALLRVHDVARAAGSVAVILNSTVLGWPGTSLLLKSSADVVRSGMSREPREKRATPSCEYAVPERAGTGSPARSTENRRREDHRRQPDVVRQHHRDLAEQPVPGDPAGHCGLERGGARGDLPREPVRIGRPCRRRAAARARTRRARRRGRCCFSATFALSIRKPAQSIVVTSTEPTTPVISGAVGYDAGPRDVAWEEVDGAHGVP